MLMDILNQDLIHRIEVLERKVAFTESVVDDLKNAIKDLEPQDCEELESMHNFFGSE